MWKAAVDWRHGVIVIIGVDVGVIIGVAIIGVGVIGVIVIIGVVNIGVDDSSRNGDDIRAVKPQIGPRAAADLAIAAKRFADLHESSAAFRGNVCRSFEIIC